MIYLQAEQFGGRVLRVGPSGEGDVDDLGRFAVDVGDRGKITLPSGAKLVQVRDGIVEEVQVFANGCLQSAVIKIPLPLDGVRAVNAIRRGSAQRRDVLLRHPPLADLQATDPTSGARAIFVAKQLDFRRQR